MNKVQISEIFLGVQGEGRNVGKPSIFIRFWGCNLRCRFNGKCCDTPYAVINEQDKSAFFTVEELVDKIKEFDCKHIVFTGGEPLLYQKFLTTVMGFLGEEYTCEVETNGTLTPELLTYKIIDQFNISVKLQSSNQEDGYDNKRINHDALNTFNTYNNFEHKCYFKFVITDDVQQDLNEIYSLTNKYKNLPVYLMPQGETREQIIKHSKEVVEICLKHKWNFSPREHIIIYNNQRGV